MHKVASEKFETKRYLLESTLGKARLIFSYRTRTTDSLAGNHYRTQVSRFCLCGEGYETSAHMSKCRLYKVVTVDLPDQTSNPYQITDTAPDAWVTKLERSGFTYIFSMLATSLTPGLSLPTSQVGLT